jgi:hypothetical protein
MRPHRFAIARTSLGKSVITVHEPSLACGFVVQLTSKATPHECEDSCPTHELRTVQRFSRWLYAPVSAWRMTYPVARSSSRKPSKVVAADRWTRTPTPPERIKTVIRSANAIPCADLGAPGEPQPRASGEVNRGAVFRSFRTKTAASTTMKAAKRSPLIIRRSEPMARLRLERDERVCRRFTTTPRILVRDPYRYCPVRAVARA